MIQVRAATATDAGAVAEILNQIINDTTVTFNSVPKSADHVAQDIEEAEVFLVIEQEHAVQGFASYGPFRKGVGYSDVKEHSICLAKSARQAGLGARLLTELEAAARANGVLFMVAGVSGENEAGLTFHAKHGYVRTGHMPEIGHKFGRRLDLVLMQKTL